MQTPIGGAGARNRQSPGCKIRGVTDLSRHLQNAMPRRLFDSAAAMKGSVYCSNRNIGQFRDQVDAASFFFHP